MVMQLRRNLFLVLNKLLTDNFSHVGYWVVLSATAAGLFGSLTHPHQNRCHLNLMTTGFCQPQRGSLQSFLLHQV